MKTVRPARIRDTVYVIGAGFSAGLGYPLTKSLLIDLWGRLDSPARDKLRKVVEFHHPSFDPKRKTSFPDIEQVLTEIAVNLDLFDASRPAEGTFTKAELRSLHESLLITIARWFHDLYEDASHTTWLLELMERLRAEKSAIVSFNWDLVLDQLLFEDGQQNYGLSASLGTGAVLLKPHGSLNWYEATQIEAVAKDKRLAVFHHTQGGERIEAFLRPREIKSKAGRQYRPLIVPPAYLKDFKRPIFQQLWKVCTDVLSTPKRLIFLGYSLPASDLHAQFILRCGFHNQIDGRLRKNGRRYPATGSAEVTIVNPDQEAARRIENVAGPNISCTWVPKRVEDWIAKA